MTLDPTFPPARDYEGLKWSVVSPDSAPALPAVYVIAEGDEFLYVGTSANVRQRLQNHRSRWLGRHPSATIYVRVEPRGDYRPARYQRETRLIGLLRPLYNREGSACRMKA